MVLVSLLTMLVWLSLCVSALALGVEPITPETTCLVIPRNQPVVKNSPDGSNETRYTGNETDATLTIGRERPWLAQFDSTPGQ